MQTVGHPIPELNREAWCRHINEGCLHLVVTEAVGVGDSPTNRGGPLGWTMRSPTASALQKGPFMCWVFIVPWVYDKQAFLSFDDRGDDRGRDGWMASPIQRTWIWASSGRWWRTGKPGVLQSMGLQRVRHDSATEQQSIYELHHGKEELERTDSKWGGKWNECFFVNNLFLISPKLEK